MSLFPLAITPLLAGHGEQYHEYQTLVKRGVGPVRQARRQLVTGLYSGNFRFNLSAAQLFLLDKFLRGKMLHNKFYNPANQTRYLRPMLTLLSQH